MHHFVDVSSNKC